MRKNLILATLLATAGATEATGASTTGGTTAPAATTNPVPDSNAAGATEAAKPKRAPKNPDNKLNIINGRLPLPLVFAIRFKEDGKATADLAKKYGTSVGKVFDIVKGRNFGYVDASYKPSAEEVKAANDWCDSGKTAKGQSLKDAGGDPDAIKALVASMGVATADEVAKRNWQTRVVGQKAEAGTAPVAGATAGAAAPAASGAAATTTAAAKPAAKLF